LFVLLDGHFEEMLYGGIGRLMSKVPARLSFDSPGFGFVQPPQPPVPFGFRNG
jgi:hypothetical protein